MDERIRQWLVTVTDFVAKQKNRIAFKIWTAVPRVEKYKIGAAAVQILETTRFILFRDDSFTRSVKYATILLREVSHQYPWLVTDVFFHIYDL